MLRNNNYLTSTIYTYRFRRNFNIYVTLDASKPSHQKWITTTLPYHVAQYCS